MIGELDIIFKIGLLIPANHKSGSLGVKINFHLLYFNIQEAIIIQTGNMKIYFITISFALLFFTKCGLGEFSFERENYTENDFNLNGFYYNPADFEFYFFYQNGVTLSARGSHDNKPEDIKEYFLKSDVYKNMYKVPYYWGIYRSNGALLEMEAWTSSDAFGGYPVVKQQAKVIDRNKISIDGEVFLFEPFIMKPDSMNEFIYR